MSQTAEVRFKLVIDGDGPKVIDQTTGAITKMSSAQAEFAKKVESAKRAMLEQKQLAKELQEFARGVGGHYDVGSVRAAAMARADQVSQLRAKGLSSGGLTVQEEAASAFEAAKRRRMVQMELEKMQGGGGLQGLVSRIPGMSGFSSGGLMAGAGAGVGAGLALFSGMADYAKRQTELDSNPWMNKGDRRLADQENMLTRYTGVTWGTNRVRDIVRWRQDWGKGEAVIRRNQVINPNELERERSITGMLGQHGIALGAAHDRGHGWAENGAYRPVVDNPTAIAGLQSQRQTVLMTTARGTTASEERKYQEELRMLAVRQNREEYRMKVIEGQKTLEDMKTIRANTRTEIVGIDRQIAMQRTAVARAEKSSEARNLGATNALKMAQQDLSELLKRRGMLGEREAVETGQIASTEKSLIQAQSGLRANSAGGTDYLKNQLDIWQDRSNVARGSAQRLAAMGPDGRFQGQMALQMAKQYGIENLPSDLQAMAASYAPREITAMQIKAGDSMMASRRGEADDFSFGVGETDREYAKAQDAYSEESRNAAVEAGERQAQSVAKEMKELFQIQQQSFDNKLQQELAELKFQASMSNSQR